jgi:protein required for attachment to host cells
MPNTRVVVAHDAGARIFVNRGPGKGLEQVFELQHEQGRKHVHELESDRQGRTFERHGQGRHAYEPAKDSKHVLLERFAARIAEELTRAFDEHRFEGLILVAPPHFLGTLKEALDERVAAVLLGTVSKDLPHASAAEVAEQLGQILPV